MTLTQTPVVEAEKRFSTTHRQKQQEDLVPPQGWKGWEKFAFRFFFIYLVIQAVPLDINYYLDLFNRDWSSFHFSNLFYAARYIPKIISDVPSYVDWLLIAAFALAGAFVWGVIDSDRRDYENLYYWLRVIVRYRLAAALLAYGFIKFFPQQMPLPSLSNLNTNYGDLTDWKIFSMSTGIVPGYQRFLGLIEILSALLLLHRKTAVVGAFIVLPFTGNVVLSNLAYEGGEYVYGSLLVSFALFIVAYDSIRLYRLAAELPVSPSRYTIHFSKSWYKTSAVVAKVTFVFVFVFLYGYQTYKSYQGGGYQYPHAAGIPGLVGLYDVKEFTINGQTIPASRTHSLRWRDVVFEQWPTVSVRSNRTTEVKAALTEEIFSSDAQKNYEYAGNAGRQFYSYQFDKASSTIQLVNAADPNDYFTFFVTANGNEVSLEGKNARGESLQVKLEKVGKKYLLEEAQKSGRRRGLKL